MIGITIAGLEDATHPHRLFLVRTHSHYGFYAGTGPEGRQVLAAADWKVLVVGLFGPLGELNCVERRVVPPGEGVEAYLAQEFGVNPGPVRVKRFRIPADERQTANPIQKALVGEDGFAISPLPLDLYEFLADPMSYGEEDRESLTHSIRIWVEREDFALYWGNEYFLDRDGWVFGS